MRMEDVETFDSERTVLQVDVTRAHPARRGSLFSPSRKDLRMIANRRACVVFALQESGVRCHSRQSLAGPQLGQSFAPAYNIRFLAADSRVRDTSGEVAQLGERCVRNAEVGSSILLFSTIASM